MTTSSVIDAAPDPVKLYGRGYAPDVEEYLGPLWKAWILKLRHELTSEEILAELWSAIDLLGDLRRNLVSFDLARKHPLRIAKKESMRYYKKAVRELKQTDLAAEFDVSKSTVSRWLSGTRDAPQPFLNRLEDLEMERYGRASVKVDGLWLALCEDPLDDPDTVDHRLVQLYEFGMEDDVTPEDLLTLAGPLTPKAMARIEEALNTPFGELPAKVQRLLLGEAKTQSDLSHIDGE